MPFNRSNFFDNTTSIWIPTTEHLEILQKTPDYISYKKPKPFIYYVNPSHKNFYQDGQYFIVNNETQTEKKYTILSVRKSPKKLKFYLIEESLATEISSQYWFTDLGVYRSSDHWGNVSNCFWKVENHSENQSSVFFCAWEDFKIWKI